MSEPGSMTTPQPTTQRQPLCKIPEGIVCSTYFSRPTTTVCPALLPPEKRTTTFTCGVITSTTLPLPSSPHCAPTITMLGMTCSSHARKVPGGICEDLGDGHPALTAPLERDDAELSSRRARLADDEGAAGALLARVGERFLDGAAQDVPRHGRPRVPQPSRQLEGARLVRREVDDEELRPRRQRRHALA